MRKMLFRYVILFGFCSTQQTKAICQESKKSHIPHIALDKQRSGFRFGIHALGGTCTQLKYDLVSFNRFQQSYNTTNAGKLQTQLGKLTPTGGLSYGVGVHGLSNYFLSFYIDVITGRQEASASAVFKNGDRREMRLVQTPICTNIDLILHLSNRVFFGMATGVEQANSKLYSGYRYANSFLSYGEDQALNGVFRSKDNRINLGARLDVSIIRQVRISLRGEYCGVFQGKQNKSSDYPNPWSDQFYRQSGSAGVNLDGLSHFYLPENVNNANNPDYYYVGLGENFAKTYRGWRLTATVIVDLLTHHN
jgi:hypothetical protein